MIKIKTPNAIARITAVLFIALYIYSCNACSSHTHEYGRWETVTEATCENEGLRVRTCACGDKEEEIIPKTAHSYVVDKGYPATFTSTGLTDGAHCSICGEVLVEQTVIEMLREEDYGYKVAIGSDEHVSVYVYSTQDYNVYPVLSAVAYSRDGLSGELLRDGNGQIDFELRFDDGYYLKEIYIDSPNNYKNLKTPDEVGKENTYRITKIKDELIGYVVSQKQVELESFGSVTDDDGEVKFSWLHDSRIDNLKIAVKVDDKTFEYNIDGCIHSWKYTLEQDKQYEFEFTPYSDGVAGVPSACTRYYNPHIKSVAFPRIEITTQDYVFPTCDYVSPPAGCIGAGTANKANSQCIIALYDSENKLRYESDGGNGSYDGAKIKVRGNSSAYSEKKPYKIKLKKNCDLLSYLLPDRTDKSYADKDWILLKNGQIANQVIGGTVSQLVGMDYTPSFAYVTLYLNGDYRGLYILCESVEQGNGTGDEQARCAVSDSGYVVEMDAYWWNEDLYFTTQFTQNKAIQWTFKYPDSDDITNESAEYLYIKDHISEFDNAIMNGDESYKQYIDLQSFAKWLLAHDILGSFDAGGSNIYVTKYDDTDDTVLKMGPLWDFDCIIGEAEAFAPIRSATHFYYPSLVKDSEFSEMYTEIYNEIKDIILEKLLQNIDSAFTGCYDDLIECEKQRWKSNNPLISEYKYTVMSWFERHLEWLSANIA